jgi:hypothetical protein
MASNSRGLSAQERQVMFDLATGFLAYRRHSDVRAAAATLNEWASAGAVVFCGDVNDAYVEVYGEVIIHTERDWLALHAAYPGPWVN